MLWFGCLIGPLLLLFAVVEGSPIPITGRAKTARASDFVGEVVWVFLMLAIVGFLINGTSNDRATMRYMIPFVLSGAVLTGRVLADRVRKSWTLIAALAVLALTYTVTVAQDLLKPPLVDRAEALAGWLDARDLHHGCGPFWDASIVTASGRGRVAVRPVWVRPITPRTHSIEPMKWMADERLVQRGSDQLRGPRAASGAQLPVRHG